MDRCFPESVITDDGVGHRRAGIAVMCVGGGLAMLGLTTVTLAYEAYSGYVAQAVLAMALGCATVGVGWAILRLGDRLGPRLHVFPPLHHSVADSWGPSHPAARRRVRVDTFPIAALPRGRR